MQYEAITDEKVCAHVKAQANDDGKLLRLLDISSSIPFAFVPALRFAVGVAIGMVAATYSKSHLDTQLVQERHL